MRFSGQLHTRMPTWLLKTAYSWRERRCGEESKLRSLNVVLSVSASVNTKLLSVLQYTRCAADAASITGLSSCSETAKDMWECSNCKSLGNGKHKGHGAADRRCPVFLARVAKMNKSRQENKYRFFCTNDPATWETNNDSHSTELNMEGLQGQRSETQRWEEARGRLGGGRRGDGGGYSQRQTDKGWEGMKDARAGSSKDNGNVQTEAPKNGRTVRDGESRMANDAGTNQITGTRVFKQGLQKGTGTQTTLNEMWKGMEKDTWSWSEDPDIIE